MIFHQSFFNNTKVQKSWTVFLKGVFKKTKKTKRKYPISQKQNYYHQTEILQILLTIMNHTFQQLPLFHILCNNYSIDYTQ